MLTGLDHGAKLVTLPRFEPDSFLNAIYNSHVCNFNSLFTLIASNIYVLILIKLQPTMLQLVPPLVSFIGHRPDLKLEAFHRLHTVFCGAAPLGPTAASKLVERLGKYDLLMQEGTLSSFS